jgi:xyloglucan-specific endo-beta-1,4-glucanase
MIWLANYNAGPISYTYGADGSPTPVASNLSLGGHTWNLYYGTNGANYVYSFLPTSGTITSFSADLNAFLQYLSKSQTLAATQYLTTVQAGTEATSGSATLTTYVFVSWSARCRETLTDPRTQNRLQRRGQLKDGERNLSLIADSL